MGWINKSTSKYSNRSTKFNSNVVIEVEDFNDLVDDFNSIFGSLVDFTDEIASFMLFPIKTDKVIIPYQSTPLNSFKQVLETSRGTSGVRAYEIDPAKTMFTLGQFFVESKNNNFSDYKGYTTLKAFLPFLGYVDIDINECINKYLQFWLYVDYFTGKCLYLIGVSDMRVQYSADSILSYSDYDMVRIISTFEANIGIELPLGSSNIGDIKRNLLLGTIKTAASVGFAMYTGALPPTTVTETVTTEYGKMARGKYKGARMKQVTGGQDTTTSTKTYNKTVDNSKPVSEAINGSIDTLNNYVPNSNTDRISDAGLLSALSNHIHIVIYRPKMIPINNSYKFLNGQPLGETRVLSSLEGYTEITEVHIEGDGLSQATKTELDEIKSRLYSGVILPTKSTITFKINGRTYSATDGMTWSEWVSSGYNTDNFVIKTTIDDTRCVADSKGYIVTDYQEIEDANFEIRPNFNYRLNTVFYAPYDEDYVLCLADINQNWNSWVNSPYNKVNITLDTEEELDIGYMIKVYQPSAGGIPYLTYTNYDFVGSNQIIRNEYTYRWEDYM